MIHRWIYHNDRLVPIEQARLSPGQEGLINGWGLFTTLRIIDGQPFAFERHWQRLKRDAERTLVPIPFDPETVRQRLLAVVAANQLTEGSARIYLIRNQTGAWHSEENLSPTDLIIYTGPTPQYREPVRLALQEHGRHAASPLAGTKVTSWLLNVWSLEQAHRAGYDEVVLLNERGEVAECTAANVFAVRDGVVRTPPLSSGCLAGITREILLELAPQAGIRLEEAVLYPHDLFHAEEIFISSTNRALLAVGEIAGHRLAAPPGALTRQLSELFNRYVQSYIARQASAASPAPQGRPAGSHLR